MKEIFVEKILPRLGEPSTWAALSTVFAGMTAYAVSDAQTAVLSWVSTAGMALCAAMGVILKEGPSAS